MDSFANDLGSPTERELLDWLAERPRTYGWDMWIACDRNTVNRSLLSDYVTRFDRHPLAGSYDGVVSIVDNQRWEYMYGVRFGAPEISFSDSRITSSRVGLRARALAGLQLTVDQPGGSARRVTKIEAYNPLQGPLLVAQVSLGELSLVPGATADMAIDLAVGENYRLAFAETDDAQRDGGDFMQRRFAEIPSTDRTAVLNHIAHNQRELFAPVEVRGRAFPGKVDGVEEEAGGVLLFIALDGSEPGAFPGDDDGFPYPIPSGCTSTVVIGTRYLMTKIMAQGVHGISVGAEFTFDNADDPYLPVSMLTATSGALRPVEISASVPPFDTVDYAIEPLLAEGSAGSAPFSIERSASGLNYRWKASSFSQLTAPLLRTSTPDAATEVDHAWVLRTTRCFKATQDGGLALGSIGGDRTWSKVLYRQGSALDASHYQHFTELSQRVSEQLVSVIEERCTQTFSAAQELDEFRNLGFYFPGGRRLHFDSVHLPAELAAFGRVVSKADAFVVSPARARVLAGGTISFETTQGEEGVEWLVSAADGFEGNVGTISAAGRYSAPERSEIVGAFTLVKVTASRAGQRSSAVVAVSAEEMYINPLVFVSWPKGPQVRVACGCLDEGDVEWEVDSPTGAALQMPLMDGEAIFERNDRIYVPGAMAGDRFFSVDEIVAKNPRTGSVTSVSALVVEKSLSGEIVIREGTTLPPGQIQFDYEGGLGPIQGADWKVVIGAGSIDGNGLYTMDPDSPHGFAVVVATYTHPGVAEMINYRILPLPLVDLDELKAILA